MIAERGYGKTERGLAEEAKAEWGYRGVAPISFVYFNIITISFFCNHFFEIIMQFYSFQMTFMVIRESR